MTSYKLIPFVARLFDTKRYRHCGVWAYENRILPPEAAEPGEFKYFRTPYFIPICEALNDPRFDIVCVMSPAQAGKTDTGFNFIAHGLDERARPSMIVLPTQKLAERMSKTRFSKLINNCESLKIKHEKGRSDNITLKIISGAPLFFNYSGSATQLCSDAVAKVYIDEYDRMSDDIDGEGSPLDIIYARMTTYPDKKAYVTSSPTLTDTSQIYKLFKEGFKAFWFLVCPKCKRYTLPCFANFKYDNESSKKVTRAWIECQHEDCKHEIDDTYEDYINEVVEIAPNVFKPKNGKYFYLLKKDEIVNPYEDKNYKKYEMCCPFKEPRGHTTASFTMSGLVSCWRTMLECAKRWLKAVESKQETRKQAVMNTVFGEPYQSEGRAPDYLEVMECSLDYDKGELLKAFSDVIIMSVDVQKDRVYYVIRGWSGKGQSALIDYGVIYGMTDETDVWKKLFALSKFRWKNYPINYVFIDSNYRPQYVFAFCKKMGKHYIPVVGRDRQNTPVKMVRIEVSMKGKKFNYGLKRFSMLDGYFKDLLYSKISNDEQTWFVPRDVCEDYCKQVTAESLVSDGIREKWVQRYKDNHYLDCEKIQVFASFVLRIDLAGESIDKDNFDETLSQDDIIELDKEKIEATFDFEETEEVDITKAPTEQKTAMQLLKDKKNLLNIWSK